MRWNQFGHAPPPIDDAVQAIAYLNFNNAGTLAMHILKAVKAQ
jgi:hypothetical protein